MPIYEYRCHACEERFEEVVRRGTRDEEIECPSCGEKRSERRLSTFAIPGVATGGSSNGGCGPTGFG